MKNQSRNYSQLYLGQHLSDHHLRSIFLSSLHLKYFASSHDGLVCLFVRLSLSREMLSTRWIESDMRSHLHRIYLNKKGGEYGCVLWACVIWACKLQGCMCIEILLFSIACIFKNNIQHLNIFFYFSKVYRTC